MGISTEAFLMTSALLLELGQSAPTPSPPISSAMPSQSSMPSGSSFPSQASIPTVMLFSSEIPSNSPSSYDSDTPSTVPSFDSDTPSTVPSYESDIPSTVPSDYPSVDSSDFPSAVPSVYPSPYDSELPTIVNSYFPSDDPTDYESDLPSLMPSDFPTQPLEFGGTPCGNCDTVRRDAGCSRNDCQSLVCDTDNFCCDMYWDGLCVLRAVSLCDGCNANPGCGAGAGCGNCNEDRSNTKSKGCDCDYCEAVVCTLRRECCEVEWDTFCSFLASGSCDCTDDKDNEPGGNRVRHRLSQTANLREDKPSNRLRGGL